MACTYLNNGAAVLKSGANPSRRQFLFYAVCVPVRLVLAALIMVAIVYFPQISAIVAIVGGLGALVWNVVLAAKGSCRWWFPSSSAILAAAAVVCGVLVLIKQTTPFLLGGLFVAHVVSGLALALHTNPWRPKGGI